MPEKVYLVWDPVRKLWDYPDRAQRYDPPAKIKRKPSGVESKKRKLAYRYGEWCYLCEEEFDLRELTIDHVMPSSRGGSNDLSNLRLACGPCNNAKADMTLREYRDSLDR